VYHEILVLLI